MRSINLRRFAVVALLAVAGCSGGGGGTPTTTTAAVVTPVVPVAPPLTNFASLIVDSGPAALQAAPKGYVADDLAYVTITICVPGTSTCQTIDHVVVDTGSVGLRIPAAVIGASLLAALPQQRDPGGNPVGECYGYVDGYAFGSVRTADFKVGGEAVAALAFHVIGDGDRFAAVPAACSAGGGTSLTGVKDIAANGILGVGVTANDCGTRCTASGSGSGAATYYTCPATGCTTVVARAATTTAPFEQLPNPVAALPINNNGVIVSLPAVADTGARTLAGTLFFGIGTQTNNGLGAATVLPTTTSTSGNSGLLTVVYKATSLTNSFIDSGSNAFFFVDAAIPSCTDTSLKGYFCPPTPLSLATVIQGRNGASVSLVLPLFNAKSLLAAGNAAVPGIGADPTATATFRPYSRSFDLGLPFFFGRNVYVAIEGRVAGTATGPYVAF